MLKLNANPAALSSGLSRPSDAPGTWWVAHTKPRMEKALAADLIRRRVAYYLPLAKRSHLSGGRRRGVLVPLFPSYFFFAGDAAVRLDVLTTQRVVHTIAVPQQRQFKTELDALHAALALSDTLTIYPHVAKGRFCRVARGPMRGIEGVVVRDADQARIVLSVSIIGRGASLEISAADLEECG